MLVVNREDCCPDRIKDAYLFVGGNSYNSGQATYCQSLSNTPKSRLYTCNTPLIGTFLKIWKTTTGPDYVLNLCELRAYSLLSNENATWMKEKDSIPWNLGLYFDPKEKMLQNLLPNIGLSTPEWISRMPTFYITIQLD